eukprot:scaffold27386_cov67-Phaeocystis_antarctica.AAC.1
MVLLVKGTAQSKSGARRKPHTRGPHAAETSSMLGTYAHNLSACSCYVGRSTMLRVRPVRLPPTCAHLATRRRHGVQVQEQLCRRALHARADGLDAADHLL